VLGARGDRLFSGSRGHHRPAVRISQHRGAHEDHRPVADRALAVWLYRRPPWPPQPCPRSSDRPTSHDSRLTTQSSPVHDDSCPAVPTTDSGTIALQATIWVHDGAVTAIASREDSPSSIWLPRWGAVMCISVYSTTSSWGSNVASCPPWACLCGPAV
jgi:hypothetical protein